MMMKSSSSTFLCALVGLTVLLCIVNEAQGFKCHTSKGIGTATESYTEFTEVDCHDTEGVKKCKEDGGKDACYKSTVVGKGFFKKCDCSWYDKDVCSDSKESGVSCMCHKELCNGATTPTLAFSTLLSASALAIITSAYWTLF